MWTIEFEISKVINALLLSLTLVFLINWVKSLNTRAKVVRWVNDFNGERPDFTKWLMRFTVLLLYFQRKIKTEEHLKGQFSELKPAKGNTFSLESMHKKVQEFLKRYPFAKFSQSSRKIRFPNTEHLLNKLDGELKLKCFHDPKSILNEIRRFRTWERTWGILFAIFFITAATSIIFKDGYYPYTNRRINIADANLIFSDRNDLIINGTFSSATKYWSIAKTSSPIGSVPSLVSNQGTGLIASLPISSNIKLTQTGVSLPQFFQRNLSLILRGEKLSKNSNENIIVLVTDSHSDVILSKNEFSLNFGQFENRINLTSFQNTTVDVQIIIENIESRQSQETRIRLTDIQIKSHVKPNSVVISLWYNYILQKRLKRSPWSDYFDLFKYTENGVLEAVYTNTRFDSIGYTVIENLAVGYYRCEARFFGITYDIKDSVFVDSNQGADVRLVTKENWGPLKVRIIDSAGAPVSNAYIKIFTHTGMEVFSPKEISDADGYINNSSLWVWPIRFYDKFPEEYYIIEVYKDGQLIGKKDKIKPRFWQPSFPVKEIIEIDAT